MTVANVLETDSFFIPVREADMDKFYRIALVSAALVAAAGIGALLRLWLG